MTGLIISEACERAAQSGGQSVVHILNSSVHYEKGVKSFGARDFNGAMKEYGLALHEIRDVSEAKLFSFVIQGAMVSCHTLTGNPSKAVEDGEKALVGLASDPRLALELAMCWNDVGSAYVDLGKLTQALDCLNKGLEIFRTTMGGSAKAGICIQNIEKIRQALGLKTSGQAPSRWWQRMFGRT